MNPIEDFINLFYKEKLNEFGMKWPDKQTFNIDFNDVERYDIELSKKIIDDPINILGEFEGVLRKWTFPYEVCNWNPRVGFYNTKHGVAIRDMRCEHINTLISVSGLVQKITIVYPKLVIASFECMRCGHVTYVVQIDNRYIEPIECEGELCGRKGPFKLLHKESTFYDTQKLRVQESPEDLTGGDQPQTTDIEICGDMTGNILPGNRINVTGILQSFQKISQTHGKTNQFELMVNGIHVQHHDIEMKIELTEQDKEDIETFSKQKNVAAKLSDLFATSIYGYEEIKEAILVSSVSGENTIKSDGTLQRGYTNLLICGDPSTAKSTLLTALKQIIPQSQFATGDGSTKAGSRQVLWFLLINRLLLLMNWIK
jgi:replicative DNA helicase Mcm